MKRTRLKDVGKYEWFDDLMAGDVVEFRGHIRKVRAVNHYPDDRVWTVTFAILVRSWTNRPYTIYCRSDLRVGLKRIIARGVSLCTTPEECRTQAEIESDAPADRHIFADDMVGRVY